MKRLTNCLFYIILTAIKTNMLAIVVLETKKLTY